MQENLTCSLCNVGILKDDVQTFQHSYKGFSEQLGYNLPKCLYCDKNTAEEELIRSQLIYDYEEYVDDLVVKFYLYSDIYIGKLFKHYKKGTIYKLVLITNLESTDQKKFPTTAVYLDVETDQVWSRPLEEFINNFTIQGN